MTSDLNRQIDTPRLFAFFVGVAAFLLQPFWGLLLGDYSWLSMPVNLAVYGFSGIFFGYLWANVGWRLGLWLFGFWFVALPLGLLLGGRQMIRAATLTSLLLILALGVAACLGAALGALVRQRLARVRASH